MFIRARSFAFVVALAVVLSAGAVVKTTAQSKVPLTHEAMWMMKRVGAPVPSPDGKWVVFSLVDPAYDEKDQVSDLWIVPADAQCETETFDFQQRRREWSCVESRQPANRVFGQTRRRRGKPDLCARRRRWWRGSASDFAFDRRTFAAMAT